MEKIIIAYASITGNTKLISESIKNKLSMNFSDKFEFELKDMASLTTEDLLNNSKFIFGSSTWSDGDLNPTADEYFSKLASSNISLVGKKFFLFGLGESFYPNFCTAIDKMAAYLKKLGAEVSDNTLKIDGDPNADNVVKAEEWAYTVGGNFSM